jgi:hypothetical protein
VATAPVGVAGVNRRFFRYVCMSSVAWSRSSPPASTPSHAVGLQVRVPQQCLGCLASFHKRQPRTLHSSIVHRSTCNRIRAAHWPSTCHERRNRRLFAFAWCFCETSAARVARLTSDAHCKCMPALTLHAIVSSHTTTRVHTHTRQHTHAHTHT